MPEIDPTKLDPKKFLRERGITPVGEDPIKKPAAAPERLYVSPGGKSSAAAAPAEAKPFNKEDYQRDLYNNDWKTRAMVGAAKAITSIPLSLGRLAGTMSPQLADVTARVLQANPAVDRTIKQMEDFAESPSNSRMETAGYYGGLLASSAMAPGIGGRALATRLSPPVFTRSGWVPGIAHKWAMRAGNAADAAAKGAIGGAIGSPDDPQTGAIGGAVLGTGASGLSALAQTPAGRSLGRHIPVGAAWSLIHHLGVPYSLAHTLAASLLYYHTPTGRRLQRVGQYLMEEGGKVIAKIPPAFMGYFGGEATGEAAKAGGEMASDVVQEMMP